MKIKTETKLALGIFTLLLALPFVAADSYQLWCLYDGESVDFGQLCAPGRAVITAPNPGFNSVCVHLLDSGAICYTNPNICNGRGLSCSNSTAGGNATIDVTPPTLIISSPTDNEMFSTRNVLINLQASERVDITYQKASDPRRWTSLCSDCFSYNRERTFEEGINEITFRAVDRARNEAFYTVQFYVDSKKPRLKSFAPTSGFVSGDFTVRFQEDNPEVLTIHYGNLETGYREYRFNLETECVKSSSETQCTTSLNLADYDGQRIEAYSTILDLGGNVDESTHYILDVDYSNPIITRLDYTVQGKKANFVIEVDEPYFSEVNYLDNSESNPKEKKLCTKLVNNICEKQITFNKDGAHEIVITVKDKAGNAAQQTINFFTDSNVPKINEVLPAKGFSSGVFEITFIEDNPTSLVLEYGNQQTGFRTKGFSLESCSRNGNKYFCSESVNLNDYNGQNIEYKFTLTDGTGQSAQKQQTGIGVDISYPIISSLEYDVSGKYVYFTIRVEEDYLSEISLIDNSDPRPKEIRLCNRVVNGICEKKISFSRDGGHDVTLKVTDLAGHVTAQEVVFFTDSKKPKINSVSPGKKFASGNFEIAFIEDNPTSLVLEYGNSALGFTSEQLSIDEDCSSQGGKYSCYTDLDISFYEGYEIDYTFTLTDRAGQSVSKGAKSLWVDTTFPVINSIDYQILGLKTEVTVSATEHNLYEITYKNNDDSSPREKSFCKRLDLYSQCSNKISLNRGTNRLDFTIYDGAGNTAVQQIVIAN